MNSIENFGVINFILDTEKHKCAPFFGHRIYITTSWIEDIVINYIKIYCMKVHIAIVKIMIYYKYIYIIKIYFQDKSNTIGKIDFAALL